jgi:hypothetical protein
MRSVLRSHTTEAREAATTMVWPWLEQRYLGDP